MQVEKVESLVVASSASALSNNLVVRYIGGGDGEAVSAAVIHRGVANLVPTKSAPPQLAQSSQVSCSGGTCVHPTTIIQVSFIETSSRTYFVVASTFGVQIFDEGGSIILFSHAVGGTSSRREQGSYCKGIAKVDKQIGEDTITWICVGTHMGVILVFLACGLDISLCTGVQAHEYSISSLASIGSYLVSGDDSGALASWSLQGEGLLKQQATKEMCNWSCSTLAIYSEGVEHNVLSGFSSGHLRIYKYNNLELRAEVAAHARNITALDVAPRSLLAVSASEDSFFRIWQLSFSQQPIALLLNIRLQHEMIVGARFLNLTGTSLCFATYDNSELFCFQIKNTPKLI